MFACVVSIRVGFRNDAELFFRFILMSFLMCLLYSSLSTLWLALLPNQIGANVVNGLVSNLFFMFGQSTSRGSQRVPCGFGGIGQATGDGAPFCSLSLVLILSSCRIVLCAGGLFIKPSTIPIGWKW